MNAPKGARPFEEWAGTVFLLDERERKIAATAWNAAIGLAAQVCEATGGMESDYHAANVRSLVCDVPTQGDGHG